MKEVTLRVRLPVDIADKAEAMNREDPEFLSRVVLYALTRRDIYRGMRERNGPSHGGSVPPPRVAFNDD